MPWVVGMNCPPPLAVRDGCVRGVRQVYEEGFVWLAARVAVDYDGYELAPLSWNEGKSARRCVIIAPRHRRAVGGSVVHRDRQPARVRQANGEDGIGRAPVSFQHGDVVDRDRGRLI